MFLAIQLYLYGNNHTQCVPKFTKDIKISIKSMNIKGKKHDVLPGTLSTSPRYSGDTATTHLSLSALLSGPIAKPGIRLKKITLKLELF